VLVGYGKFAKCTKSRMVRVRVVVRIESTLATHPHVRDVWRRRGLPESVGWTLVAGSDAAAGAAVGMPCLLDGCM
jgi:hypothetical protein